MPSLLLSSHIEQPADQLLMFSMTTPSNSGRSYSEPSKYSYKNKEAWSQYIILTRLQHTLIF